MSLDVNKVVLHVPEYQVDLSNGFQVMWKINIPMYLVLPWVQVDAKEAQNSQNICLIFKKGYHSYKKYDFIQQTKQTKCSKTF